MSRYLYICPGCRLHTDELQEPECPRCGNEDTCSPVDVTAFATLAANLGIAAGLCRAHDIGRDSVGSHDAWYPGFNLKRYADLRAELMRLREEQS